MRIQYNEDLNQVRLHKGKNKPDEINKWETIIIIPKNNHKKREKYYYFIKELVWTNKYSFSELFFLIHKIEKRFSK